MLLYCEMYYFMEDINRIMAKTVCCVLSYIKNIVRLQEYECRYNNIRFVWEKHNTSNFVV